MKIWTVAGYRIRSDKTKKLHFFYEYPDEAQATLSLLPQNTYTIVPVWVHEEFIKG